jgi:hypothetical protein
MDRRPRMARRRGVEDVEAWTGRGEKSFPLKRRPWHRRIGLSRSLLSVSGDADGLGIDSIDREKTLEELDFTNFLNYPSFFTKK